jgi:hypothetical protein
MDIDTVTLFEGTRAVKRWEVEVDPSSRVLRFETAHPLEASADTFFYVQVQGDTPLPTAPHLQVTPFAMTNAIWVDGDRDGQYTPSVP